MMDKTEQNIKMLEKAEEIQKGWKPSVGDVFAHKYDDGRRVVEENPIYKAGGGIAVADKGDLIPLAVSWEDRQDRYVWLPHQTQLREMVGKKDDDGADQLFRFYWWFQDAKTDDVFLESWIGLSMEQLWLAFVMKEKYNKVWDGEKWIKKQ